jgi:hypothetical protein
MWNPLSWAMEVCFCSNLTSMGASGKAQPCWPPEGCAGYQTPLLLLSGQLLCLSVLGWRMKLAGWSIARSQFFIPVADFGSFRFAQVAAILAIILLDYPDFCLILALLVMNATISYREEASADKVRSRHDLILSCLLIEAVDTAR